MRLLLFLALLLIAWTIEAREAYDGRAHWAHWNADLSATNWKSDRLRIPLPKEG